MHVRTRRYVSLFITVIACAVVFVACQLINNRLGHAGMLTGWTLLASVGILMMLGLRKRFVMLPLLPVRFWTQLHIYTGTFALFIYVLHVPTLLASGLVEGTLSILFLTVCGSGVYGVWISRRGARRLTAVPGEYRYDQIGWHRRVIADRAWDILEELGDSEDVPVLARFYRDRLRHFFSARPSLAYVLVPTSVRRRRLLRELGELDRYFSDSLKQASGRLAALIRSRDDLDFHYATQLRMKLWLVIHVSITGALLVFMVTHVLMVLRFRGG